MRSELTPERLSTSLIAGAIIGILEIAQATSFAALIFRGDLSGYLGRGIGLALMSGMISLAVVSLLTLLPITVGGNQDVPAAVVGVMAASIAMALGNTYSAFVTVLAAVALTTLATGVFLLFLGVFKLARLIRFLPYPVAGGFLAGTGWLMLSGGVSMMANVPFSISEPGALFAPGVPAHWLPGLAFGVLLLFLSGRIRHYMLMPGLIVGATIAFFVVARGLGASMMTLSANGWLLGPFPEGDAWQPLSMADLSLVQWSALVNQVPNMLATIAISVIALLLNATGLELVARREIDLDREMRVAGWGNLLAGPGSGLIGYQQLGLSALNERLGVKSRLPGFIAAAITGVALLLSGEILGLFPKFVFGGLLVYLGLSFLWEWVVEARSKLPRVDYVIVLIILVVIALFGFLQGVAVGIIATVVMFVVNYSVVDVVIHSLSADTYRSRVTRPLKQREILDDVGQQAHILELQGFLFFGTAHNLLERTRRHLADSDRPPLHYMLLDFSRVTGLDSTAVLSFLKMTQLAATQDLTLLVTGPSPEIRHQLTAGGFLDDSERVRVFDSLDRGLEWSENRMLERAGCRPDEPPPPLHRQLVEMLGDDASAAAVMRYLERLEPASDTYLIRRGDDADAMYFVEAGQVTAQVIRKDGQVVRLETIMGCQVVGEIGFYLNIPRTVDVVIEAPSVVYRLTRETLATMESGDPEAASSLHRLIIHLLSERVVHLAGTVEALQQ